MVERKPDKAWAKIIEANPGIVSETRNGGVFEITADEIKRFREPRLMTKHDTSESVPSPLKLHGLNVLALGGSPYKYAIGQFELFEPFPDVNDLRPEHIALPDFETLTVRDISSEANAINALIISETLGRFLGERSELFETFNGRMGSDSFHFKVRAKCGIYNEMKVAGAQLEIDGGFESEDSVVIMEAKNVLHDDFNVRQLYYPYRRYKNFVRKPVRLVFSQYTNLTYNLFEYEFTDLEDYSSLSLVRRAAYTFEDRRITASELYDLWMMTEVETDDNMEQASVPFIQADRFDRVVALCEHMRDEREGLSTEAVVGFLGTVDRQGPYYLSAGEYLGLFDRNRSKGMSRLTPLALRILREGQRERSLMFAQQMFKHQIFHDLFGMTFEYGEIPDRNTVIQLMERYNVCKSGDKGSMFYRRAGSVIGWMKWIMNLIDED